MIQTLDKIDGCKVKLSVPLVASYLSRGIRQADIARICNVSPQAVNDYIKRHSDQLAPLIDGENILIMKAKHIASKAQENIITILDDTPEKKDMFALNAISGTHIDKYRLLSDKSTQNVSMAVNDSNLATQQADNIAQAKATQALRSKLARLIGEGEV